MNLRTISCSLLLAFAAVLNCVNSMAETTNRPSASTSEVSRGLSDEPLDPVKDEANHLFDQAMTLATEAGRATTPADFDDAVGSGYVFQITTDGYYSVWKQVGGSWSWLQSWTTSPAVSTGFMTWVNLSRKRPEGSTLPA